MEERDQLLIEGYLANQLSVAERAEVEQRMKDDPLFLQEITNYELAKQSLQVQQREALRQRFKSRDELLDADTNESKKNGGNWKGWIGLLVFIVLAILIWKFILPLKGPASINNQDNRDTTQIQEQITHDTLSPDNLQQKDKPEKDVKAVQNQLQMAEARQKGQELFAEYFEPYKDETLTPVSRSSPGELTPLEKFRLSYWNGKHQETISHFTTLNPDLQRNDNLRFVYANSLMASNRDTEARIILQDIVSENRAEYLMEAIWYLGLINLKLGDEVNARKYLQQIVDNPKGYHKAEAKTLLEKLK